MHVYIMYIYTVYTYLYIYICSLYVYIYKHIYIHRRIRMQNGYDLYRYMRWPLQIVVWYPHWQCLAVKSWPAMMPPRRTRGSHKCKSSQFTHGIAAKTPKRFEEVLEQLWM